MAQPQGLTVGALLDALRHGGDVYTQIPPLPSLARLHKTSLVATLQKMPADAPMRFTIHHPDNIGHWARPRRYIRLYPVEQPLMLY